MLISLTGAGSAGSKSRPSTTARQRTGISVGLERIGAVDGRGHAGLGVERRLVVVLATVTQFVLLDHARVLVAAAALDAQVRGTGGNPLEVGVVMSTRIPPLKMLLPASGEPSAGCGPRLTLIGKTVEPVAPRVAVRPLMSAWATVPGGGPGCRSFSSRSRRSLTT